MNQVGGSSSSDWRRAAVRSQRGEEEVESEEVESEEGEGEVESGLDEESSEEPSEEQPTPQPRRNPVPRREDFDLFAGIPDPLDYDSFPF